MAASDKETEEWRLGIEAGGHDAPEASEEAGALRNYSAERLERPLCVVTAEHLGWAVAGALALASRFVMLGERPLDSAEAGHALGELALLRNGPSAAAHLSWIHLLEAAVFAALGAGDFGARVIFAMSGLLLIAAGFAMRRHLGRAGAIAFAALLVLSPSVAYFSRADDSVVPALAFAVLALALFLELADEPGRLVAAGLGVAVGLGLATGGAALMTALFMLAALATVGLMRALADTRVRLRVRVWWTRRKALCLITTAVAAVVWLGCESEFFTRSPLGAIVAAFRANFSSSGPGGHRGFVAGLDFYLPILALYEFLVVLLALIGALGVLTLRIRSRLATGALVWSAIAVAFYLWTPARSPAFVIQMIVPMALLGAFVIDYLHHTVAWTILCYPLGVLALLTLYVQVTNNFLWYAPDASQAPWARTALLYWTDPATTLQTPVQCARVLDQAPSHGASAFFASDSPVLRWYLRALAPAATAEDAAAIVGGVELARSEAQGATIYEFELSDAWHPAWWSLSPQIALHYLLNAHAWAPPDSRRVTVAVRPIIAVAPTVILAPPEPPPTAGPAASPGHSEPGPAAPASSAAPGKQPLAAPSAAATPVLGPGRDSRSSSGPGSSPAAISAATPAAIPSAVSVGRPSATPAGTPAGKPAGKPGDTRRAP
ncbi:MAG TPA: hypothetical protein VNE82_23870 [Candidatus Binataceae bacterium]|nr:hypothetical protein [Candidatus Binataceae bacterium]